MIPSHVIIGNNLVFGICTHNPDTGALTDADSAPTYRVYEDETATPILTGTMAKLDDANTLGFYTELLACTLANGFEANKTYTIYVEATVAGVTGGIPLSFNITDRAAGSGAIQFVYTLTSAVDASPIADAQVWVSTDSAGANIVASGTTDANGQVTFYLDAGTVYVWRQKSGWNFTNPDQETVA